MALLVATSTASATPTTNGPYINGPYINGPYINGPYINGPYINSPVVDASVGAAWMNGAVLGGLPIEAAKGPDKQPWVAPGLYGSELHGGSYVDGVFVDRRGVDVAGAEMWASLVNSDGVTARAVKLVIDGAELVPGGTYATGLIRDPYFHYFVSVIDDYNRAVPMCGPGVAAVALEGEWNYQSANINGGKKISSDPSRVTFGCENGALGKCASKLGYRPWETNRIEVCDEGGCRWETASMADMHQACTRMVRADYCGDGTTHTIPDVPIEVVDNLGQPEPGDGLRVPTQINRNTLPPSGGGFQLEATWKAEGAVSADCARLDEAVVTCPSYSTDWRGPLGRLRRRVAVRRDFCSMTLNPGSVITDYRRATNVVVAPHLPFLR